MAITPKDIEQQTFSAAKKGYNTDEVDEFLEKVADEVETMIQKIADLKSRLNTAEQQLAAAQSKPVVSQAAVAAPAAQTYGTTSASEQQISKVLIAAQQLADKTVDDARSAAENIRNEADAKAREVVQQVLGEKQAELDEINRIRESREKFANEYKAMLKKFSEDADATFSAQNPAPSIQTSSSFSDYGSAQPSTPAASQMSPYSASSIFGDLD